MDSLKQIFVLDPAQLRGLLPIIPALPLLGALLNGLLGRWYGNERSGLVACATVAGSFFASVLVFLALASGQLELHQTVYTWFSAGILNVQLGLTADRLSGVLLLVVTGVGFLIHLYSTSYMEHDAAAWRYFSYLNLFVAAMLLLILGDNLVTLFVGWEGVGLCSYLLIGFWYQDEAKASAGKKAFVVNRIGDFGFLIGIFTLFAVFGTTNIDELRKQSGALAAPTNIAAPGAPSSGLDVSVRGGVFAARTVRAADGTPVTYPASTYRWAIALAMLCLFIGATGKSAQIPLYVWLPDAMAGPTPVSALIHAATMVTAGVYMVARMSFLYVLVPQILAIVAVVGALTALWAALVAFAQNDVKKVLAYSTVSQLGFMFMGVGSAAFSAGTFHLFTHAFFKACLFLGAGAVIHGLRDEQDIRRMGGLRHFLPHTRWTFLIATVAIAGVLPFSGFFSKDEILHAAFVSPALHAVAPWLGPAVYVVGTATALCTAFYMFRLYFLVFEGDYRGNVRPHEAPWPMTSVLWILAGLSIAAAFIGTPWWNWFEHFTEPAVAKFPGAEAHEGVALWPFGVAIAIAVGGFLWARSIYARGVPEGGAPFARRFPVLARASENKFYVDEFYGLTIVRPLWAGAKALHAWADALLVDRILVGGWGWLAKRLGGFLSLGQDGDMSRYAAVTALAAVALLLWAGM